MPTELRLSQLEIGGTLHEVALLGNEPTKPGYGYTVDVYKVKGEPDNTIDVAKANVFPDSYTPPQRVKRSGMILDFPMEGSGTLLIYRNGDLETIDYDQRNPDHQNLAVVYSAGSYICWKAGPRGLKFIEVCSPPYRNGDLINLNINSPGIPLKFKEAFIRLTTNNEFKHRL